MSTVTKAAIIEMQNSHPSDEIILDESGMDELMSFYDDVVGKRDNGIADIVLSQTVPIRDVRIKSDEVPAGARFCIFENALDGLDSAPDGRELLVGAMQFCKDGSFVLLAVIKGNEQATISDEVFDRNGNPIGRSDPATISGLWHIWCAVEFALLHPQVKTVFANPRKGKEYTREKGPDGKRRRVVRYIRRHYIGGPATSGAIREFTRHCLCWYVIGHWRHLSDGRTIYIKGYWKGELRELQRNIDAGRIRQLTVQNAGKKEGV